MNFKTALTILGIISFALLATACNQISAPPTSIPAPLTTPTRSGAVLPTDVATKAPLLALTPTQTSQSPTVTKPASSSATSSATTPKVLSFTVVPTTTHTLGEKISAAWQAQGTQATLCPFVMTLSGPVAQEQACSTVPLAGTKTIAVTENDLDWNGMMLRVTTGAVSDQSIVSISLGCQGLYNWFFSNAPERCPQAAPITSSAAAQHFEHGLMIWMKQPDRFYVFYNENPQVFEWIEAPYRFKPGASANNRVGVTPLTGLFEPVSGFGQIWRGEIEGLNMQNVRQRLGWAKDTEFAFNTAYQCARSIASTRLWICYMQNPDGKVLVLRPDSSAQVRFVWNEQ